MSKGRGAVVRRVALTATLLAIGFSRIAGGAGPVSTPSMAATPALPTPPPRPVEIDRNSALIMIRSALIALQQANQTGNYSVVYALSSPGFQKQNPPERLSQIFSHLRAKNFDLSGVLVLEPQLTVLPEIYANGTMRMAGFFPSVPMQVYFDLQFSPVQGQWRIIALSVDVGSATLAAPTPNPALAASYSPSPAQAPSPNPTPTPTATAAQPTVEVDTGAKPKHTPRKGTTPNSRQSLGRTTPNDH